MDKESWICISFMCVCWCCWPKIIKISPCLSKPHLAKIGAFFESQCRIVWLRRWKNFEDILTCFDTIHECDRQQDRQTDERTDTVRRHRLRLRIAACGKKSRVRDGRCLLKKRSGRTAARSSRPLSQPRGTHSRRASSGVHRWEE